METKPRSEERDLSVGPDCREGKHRACDGRGFDLVADVVIECACHCHDVTHSEPSFADTCCGKCPGATCYVDQMTGA